MKAITIWQPWASLLACGAKRFETRSWATSYRGPIAIHAAKKDVFDALSMIPVPTAVGMKKLLGVEWKELPTGAVIATATLIGCHEIDRIREMSCAPQETACRSCNHYKASASLEGFRKLVENMPHALARDSVTYRNAVRFGLVEPKPHHVIFYFELMEGDQT